MPRREAVRTPVKRLSDKINRIDMTPTEAKERAKRKAKIAQLLKRGLVDDLLVVRDLPKDRRGVYVREREVDINKYQALGYRIETKFGQKRENHDPGTRVRIGDVVLMTTDRENYELIQEVKAEATERKLDAGKKDYLAQAAHNPDVPVFDMIEESENG